MSGEKDKPRFRPKRKSKGAAPSPENQPEDASPPNPEGDQPADSPAPPAPSPPQSEAMIPAVGTPPPLPDAFPLSNVEPVGAQAVVPAPIVDIEDFDSGSRLGFVYDSVEPVQPDQVEPFVPASDFVIPQLPAGTLQLGEVSASRFAGNGYFADPSIIASPSCLPSLAGYAPCSNQMQCLAFADTQVEDIPFIPRSLDPELAFADTQVDEPVLPSPHLPQDSVHYESQEGFGLPMFPCEDGDVGSCADKSLQCNGDAFPDTQLVQDLDAEVHAQVDGVPMDVPVDGGNRHKGQWVSLAKTPDQDWGHGRVWFVCTQCFNGFFLFAQTSVLRLLPCLWLSFVVQELKEADLMCNLYNVMDYSTLPMSMDQVEDYTVES